MKPLKRNKRFQMYFQEKNLKIMNSNIIRLNKKMNHNNKKTIKKKVNCKFKIKKKNRRSNKIKTNRQFQ